MSRNIKSSPRFRLVDIIDPPLIRGQYDDEFDSDVLDPSWTPQIAGDGTNPIDPWTQRASGGWRWSLNNQSNGGVISRPSWFLAQPTPADNCTLNKTVSLPTECFVWARMSFGFRNAGQTNNEMNIVLQLVDNTISGVYINLNEMNTNVASATSASITNGTGTELARSGNIGGAPGEGQPAHVVGIQKINTTYHFWVMSSAGNWIWMNSTTSGVTVTLARISIIALATGAPGNLIGGVDFFRIKNGRYLP